MGNPGNCDDKQKCCRLNFSIMHVYKFLTYFHKDPQWMTSLSLTIPIFPISHWLMWISHFWYMHFSILTNIVIKYTQQSLKRKYACCIQSEVSKESMWKIHQIVLVLLMLYCALTIILVELIVVLLALVVWLEFVDLTCWFGLLMVCVLLCVWFFLRWLCVLFWLLYVSFPGCFCLVFCSWSWLCGLLPFSFCLCVIALHFWFCIRLLLSLAKSFKHLLIYKKTKNIEEPSMQRRINEFCPHIKSPP